MILLVEADIRDMSVAYHEPVDAAVYDDFGSEWTKTGVTITANAAAAPGGEVTAEHADCSLGTSARHIKWSGSFTAGRKYRLGLAVKYVYGNLDFTALAFEGSAFPSNSYCFFLTYSGSIGANGNSSNVTATIEDLGDSWYYCQIEVFATSTTTGTVAIYLHNTDDAGFGSFYTGANARQAFADLELSYDEADPIVTRYFSSDAYNPSDAPGQFLDRIVETVQIGREARGLYGIGADSYSDLILANKGGDLDYLIEDETDGREIRAYLVDGPGSAYSTKTALFTARMGAAVARDLDRVSIPVADIYSTDLDKPFHSSFYAGTNSLPDGLEGTEDDLKDSPKPEPEGVLINVTPPLVNTSVYIYQFSNGDTDIDVTAVYEGGVEMTRGTDYSSVSDMETNAPTAGQYRVLPRASGVGGYFRLGSSPTHTITCDLSAGNNGNLLTDGDDFSSASWGKSGLAVSSYHDPLSGEDHTLLDATSTTSPYLRQTYSFVSGSEYTVSVLIFPHESTGVYFRVILPDAAFPANSYVSFYYSGDSLYYVNGNSTDVSVSGKYMGFVFNKGKAYLVSVTVTADASASDYLYLRLSASSGSNTNITSSDGFGCDYAILTEASPASTAVILKALAMRAGMAEAQIDTASVSALSASLPDPIGVWEPSETTILSVMDRIAEQTGCYFATDATGKLIVGQVAIPEGDPVATFKFAGPDTPLGPGEYDIETIEGIGLAEPEIISKGTILFARNHTVQTGLETLISEARRNRVETEWLRETFSNPSLRYSFANVKERTFETPFATREGAQSYADALRARTEARMRSYRLSAPFVSGLEAVIPGAVVSVAIPRFGMDAGKLFRVARVILDPLDGRIEMEIVG